MEGTQEQLKALNTSAITGTVSVTGAGDGITSVSVKVLGLTDVTIVDEEVTVRVEIKE